MIGRSSYGKTNVSAVSLQPIQFSNEIDLDDNPAGGQVTGIGFFIDWQDGPINRDAGEAATGAFVEDVVDAVINRMEFYQSSKFACEENAKALAELRSAKSYMMQRRWDREGRGVLGKHEA